MWWFLRSYTWIIENFLKLHLDYWEDILGVYNIIVISVGILSTRRVSYKDQLKAKFTILLVLNGDGSSMTTTLQTVQYACAMCVVEYVDQQSASTPPTHKSFHPHYHHHFGLLRSSYSFARDCKRERERDDFLEATLGLLRRHTWCV